MAQSMHTTRTVLLIVVLAAAPSLAHSPLDWRPSLTHHSGSMVTSASKLSRGPGAGAWGGLAKRRCGRGMCGRQPWGMASVDVGMSAFAGKMAPLDQVVEVAKWSAAAWLCVAGSAALGRRWVAVGAWRKFRSKAPVYLTIPAIAGLLNWATNQLAVWMIFNPQEFAGIPLISREREGEPLGFFGWQGIIPSKVRKMAGDIVDMTLGELVDAKTLFSRVDSRTIAEQLREGGLLAALADAAEETGTLHPWLIAWARARATGGGVPLVGRLLEWKAMRVVSRTVEGVKEDPLAVCALKPAIISDLAVNKHTLCELFQKVRV
ncbi:hypothetical protein T484DRAFT_1912238 [Baffinella frigidus]|nr:hypothetical protein T484DRAFT_1912238 [Cryptophyta sp. CCMP2293]